MRQLGKQMSCIVAALEGSMGIGKDGGLPWKSIPGDMKYFKEKTIGNGRNAVIMGRKTWDSIPAKFRPLKDRLNVVISRSPNTLELPGGVLGFGSFQEAYDTLNLIPTVEDIMVIGGAQVYREAMNHPACRTILLTRVSGITADCDVFFPDLESFECVEQSDKQADPATSAEFVFCTYQKPQSASIPTGLSNGDTSVSRNHEEYQYLDLVRRVIAEGNVRGDRTGTGTHSIFGTQMRFSLRNNVIPVLTTKRVFWRGVAEELFWFIHGSTDSKILSEKRVKIWDGNGSREFLDKLGFTDREEGDLGPVYGFQWRHFGAEYKDCHSDYRGQGVDQLQQCIDKIKTSPEDRRIILSAWNPAAIPQMALPPCHVMCQFYVADGELSCQMYQRSADLGLGVPFNIASYALLTHLMAHVCGLKAGDFVHTIGDAHVYANHVEALQTQLERHPRPFPTLQLNTDKTRIEDFGMDDVKLIDYNPLETIKMKMAV